MFKEYSTFIPDSTLPNVKLSSSKDVTYSSFSKLLGIITSFSGFVVSTAMSLKLLVRDHSVNSFPAASFTITFS